MYNSLTIRTNLHCRDEISSADVCLQQSEIYYIHVNVFLFVFVHFAPCNIVYEGFVLSFTISFGNMYL
jgi:hypothetical protein